MTPAIQFDIPGVPVGKSRPRVTKRGITYTPAKSKAWERVVAWSGKAAMGAAKPLEGPVGVHMRFAFPVPRSWSKKKREAARWHTGAPDTDNLIKSCCDALNQICWVDDRQVVSITASKQYGETPGVFVQVWPIL